MDGSPIVARKMAKKVAFTSVGLWPLHELSYRFLCCCSAKDDPQLARWITYITRLDGNDIRDEP
jgi:hypothetical protein